MTRVLGDGCEFATFVMGMPVVCEKCPAQKVCGYETVDVAIKTWLDTLIDAKKELREPVESMKGHPCLYKDNLFCQEGECRECEIYQARGKHGS